MARKVQLFDQHGRPLAPRSYGFFDGLGPDKSSFSSYYYNAAQDTEELLDEATWFELMSAGRKMFANWPILRGAILEQANFSLPLSAHYDGDDSDWGDMAEDWVFEWQKNCNVRGPLYNAQVVSRLRLIGRKVDGDIFTALVRSNKGDFPKTQLIRAHRVRDRYGFGGEIKKGPHKGKRSKNGVVLDEDNSIVAYCLPGAKESDDQYISANDCFPLYRPDFGDEWRGISELCATIRTAADIKRLREWEMIAQQMVASEVFVEKNDTGTADETDDTLNGGGTQNANNTGLILERYEGGLKRYYRAKSGAGLEVVRGDRPSQDAQSWEDRMMTQAFYGIEWDPNFALAIKEPGGAWARVVLQKILRGIANNVRLEAWAQQVEIGFAIGQAIKDKVLPMPKDGNFHSWKICLGIPLPTADSGNDESAKREAYKLGWTTLQAIAAGTGGWWKDVRKQRDVELRDLLTRTREISADFPELTFREVLMLQEQRTPNANGPAEGKGAATEPDDDDKEKKV